MYGGEIRVYYLFYKLYKKFLFFYPFAGNFMIGAHCCS
jgi:hypothetical protein